MKEGLEYVMLISEFPLMCFVLLHGILLLSIVSVLHVDG